MCLMIRMKSLWAANYLVFWFICSIALTASKQDVDLFHTDEGGCLSSKEESPIKEHAHTHNMDYTLYEPPPSLFQAEHGPILHHEVMPLVHQEAFLPSSPPIKQETSFESS
eukprot:c36911_g1_i1 orf=1-330(-)